MHSTYMCLYVTLESDKLYEKRTEQLKGDLYILAILDGVELSEKLFEERE